MLSLRSARMNRLVAGLLTFLVLGTVVSLFMVHDARNEIREKDERARQCYQNAESLNSQLHVSKGKVKQLEDSLRIEIEARKEESTKLHKNVDELVALRTQDRADREAALKRTEETISSLKKQISDIQSELSRQVETNHNLIREKTDQASRADEGMRELEKYKAQAAEMTAEMQRQIHDLKVELQRGGDCKSNMVELRRQLNEAQAKLAANQQQNSSLAHADGVSKAAVMAPSVKSVAPLPLPDIKSAEPKNGVNVIPAPAPVVAQNGDQAEKQFLVAPEQGNQVLQGKMSSPKPKNEEGVGQKPPAEEDLHQKMKNDDVIQRPSFDNAEEQEDDQPGPALKLARLRDDAARNPQYPYKNKAHKKMAIYKKAGAKSSVHPEVLPVWREGNAVPQDNGWKRRDAGPFKKSLRGDHNQIANNNYADFDDGDANRHNFDQIGEADVAADRLKPHYNDYLGENNQEEGDDAVDGRIPAPGEEEIKDDNIFPVPPLEQLGRRGNNVGFPDHKRRPLRQARTHGEAGEVFVVSGNNGEEGVMVNPH